MGAASVRGEAASLTAGPKLLRVKSPDMSSSTAGSGWSFALCTHVQLTWQSDNFTGSSVPLIESLKSKAHLITDARKRKNLTHLQRVLLFKDSSVEFPTPAQATIVTTLTFWFAHARSRKAISSSRPKTSLHVMGSLAIETFFGPGLTRRLRVPAREVVEDPFCRL